VNPQCSCCLGHANYLRQHGFNITVKETREPRSIALFLTLGAG
jgi:hypothetical protein